MTDEGRDVAIMNASEALNLWRGFDKRWGSMWRDVPRVLEAAVAIEEALRAEQARLAELRRQHGALEAELAQRRQTCDQECAQRISTAQQREAEVDGRIAAKGDEVAKLEGAVAEAKATIRRGEEWQAKMDEAAAIARGGGAR